jgi:peptidoglycan/LPS O-acetylase OafA/YrhL
MAGPAHRVLFVHSPWSPDFYFPAALLLAIAGVLLIALRKHPRRKLYCFCAAWFAIAISPVLYLPALLPDQLVHDNYAYLPSVGLCVAVADWAIEIAKNRAGNYRAFTAR